MAAASGGRLLGMKQNLLISGTGAWVLKGAVGFLLKGLTFLWGSYEDSRVGFHCVGIWGQGKTSLLVGSWDLATTYDWAYSPTYSPLNLGYVGYPRCKWRYRPSYKWSESPVSIQVHRLAGRDYWGPLGRQHDHEETWRDHDQTLVIQRSKLTTALCRK